MKKTPGLGDIWYNVKSKTSPPPPLRFPLILLKRRFIAELNDKYRYCFGVGANHGTWKDKEKHYNEIFWYIAGWADP